MDEQFHHSPLAGNAELGELIGRRSDRRSLLRFALQYGLLLGSAVFVALWPGSGLSPWTLALALLVFALMTMAMFAIVHESSHNTVFRQRRHNRLICWLASVPVYYVPTGFREFHFAHHRHTNVPGLDPELAIGGRPSPGLGSHLVLFLLFVSGLPLLLYKIALVLIGACGAPRTLGKGFLFFVPGRSRRRIIWESRLVLALHGGLLAAGLLWLPGLLWLLTGQVLGHLLLSLYLIGEHTGLATEGDILGRTRSTRTNPLLAWLMWNMPWHAEHHAYPAVPWHALPDLERLLGPEVLHVERGYGRFHRRALASLLKGRAFEDSRPAETAPELNRTPV